MMLFDTTTMTTLSLVLCFFFHVPGSSCASRDTMQVKNVLRSRMIMIEDEQPQQTIFLLAKKDNVISRFSVSHAENGAFQPESMDFMTHMITKGKDRSLQENACDAELNSMQGCFSSISICNSTCVGQAFQNFLDGNAGGDCDVFTAAFCPSIAGCGCATCEDEVSNYLNCRQQECFLPCGSTLTPTPAPTQQTKCSDENEVAVSCVQNLNNNCGTCIDDAYKAIFANDDDVRCNEFSDSICSAIKNECDCIECGKEVEGYFRCTSACRALDCNLDSTPSPTNLASSPTIASPSPVAPGPSTPSPPDATTESPVATAPRGEDDQTSKDGGGISTGVIIGAIGGIVIVVGMIIGAILYSRRKRPSHSDQKTVPKDTSHDETEFNPPSTPGRQSQYGSSPASQNSPITQSYAPSSRLPPYSNVPSTSNSAHPPYAHLSQPTSSRSYPSQYTNEKGSGHSPSSTSTSSTREYSSPYPSPPRTSSAYMPTNKDQCRTVLVGEPIVVEATPIPSA